MVFLFIFVSASKFEKRREISKKTDFQKNNFLNGLENVLPELLGFHLGFGSGLKLKTH